MFLHTDSEDSDQTGWMPRLIGVIAGRTGHFVGFVMRQLVRIPVYTIFRFSINSSWGLFCSTGPDSSVGRVSAPGNGRSRV